MNKDKGKGKKTIQTIIRENLVYLIAGGVILTICLAIIIGSKVWHPYFISGTSMVPTYQSGEIVKTIPYEGQELKRGDIVVAQADGTTVIKRVAAVSGDTIQIKDGIVYVNRQAVTENFPLIEDAGIAAQEITIPEGSCFLLGDNRNASIDSRVFGCVTKEQIRSIVSDKLF